MPSWPCNKSNKYILGSSFKIEQHRWNYVTCGEPLRLDKARRVLSHSTLAAHGQLSCSIRHPEDMQRKCGISLVSNTQWKCLSVTVQSARNVRADTYWSSYAWNLFQVADMCWASTLSDRNYQWRTVNDDIDTFFQKGMKKMGVVKTLGQATMKFLIWMKVWSPLF